MGKGSSFPRVDRDDYPTPYKATTPSLECLKPRSKFIDPCCGAGCLVAQFESAGHVCVGRYDLPDRDVVSARCDDVEPDAIFLTNLPWRRDLLHPANINLSNQPRLWTLLDAGWLLTMQATSFMARLRGIVAVGRLKWISLFETYRKRRCRMDAVRSSATERDRGDSFHWQKRLNQGSRMISGAADAFDPLAPGAYPGAIEPGAFVEHVVRKGNRHGALGLRLSIGEGEHRVVRCSFLLESPTALGAARRDAEMLARWADLVDAVPARNWHGLLKNLWTGQRRLSVSLDFTIRPAERGTGYVLVDVKVSC